MELEIEEEKILELIFNYDLLEACIDYHVNKGKEHLASIRIQRSNLTLDDILKQYDMDDVAQWVEENK